MGNIILATLYSRQENSCWEFFTASDLMLDQMEKQTFLTATPSWMDLIAHYCNSVLSTLAMVLISDVTTSLKQPKMAPILVDAACQTEKDTIYSELTITKCNLQSYHAHSMHDIIHDSYSCTSEMTECCTSETTESCTSETTGSCTSETTESPIDAENDERRDNFNEWKDKHSSADHLFQATYDAYDKLCDYEPQAEKLPLDSAIECPHSGETLRSINVKDYLCMCGECPQYKEIAHDVTVTLKGARCNFLQKQSIIHLLQAFSTYNEVMGYHVDMIPTAYDCLRVWSGDHDKAFQHFVTIYDKFSTPVE
ncbi:unnamed protein product [Peronospora belbahrii]|uniref:Uncharacterized protein n=1 Tax=Peronospora belbahrii TaxID=622444 RepID=A0ABN8CN36_9STRA|nr:unnamed protein product [Peronospora belbahrii]